MGSGASSQASLEQMLACTMILGEAMVQGLDPRFVRFPDLYRIYDFQVGPKAKKLAAVQPANAFESGSMVIFVHSPDGDGKFQAIELDDSSGAPSRSIKSTATTDDDDADLPSESNADVLVLSVGDDKVVLDRATLHQPNCDGWTPLHACCHAVKTQEAGIAILHALIAQRADLNIQTKRGPGAFSCGWTPLHIACAYGLEVLALKLIRAGADVNVTNSVGWTPLYDACHRGYATVARELLKAGAKADVVCPEFALCPYPGQRALAEAARQGHADTVKVLLDWGVDKNAVNKLGWTALHEAAYHSRLSIAKMLIVYGADVFVKTPKGSLAKDVTIHSEIRAMLEDLGQQGPAPSSPKREKAVATDSNASVSLPTQPRSPTRTQSLPLSRKEEYALLGDLPSLDTKAMPTISIQDSSGRSGIDGDDCKTGDNRDDDVTGRDAKAAANELGHARSTTQHSKHKHRKSTGSNSQRSQRADAPDAFKCAVSRKVLKDPLRSPFGQVFERDVIEAWFRDFGNRCPLTGEPLTLHQLVPDAKLKAQIREWKHGSPSAATAQVDSESTAADAFAADDAKATNSVAEEVATADTSADVDPYDF